jgi:hypothetical protein
MSTSMHLNLAGRSQGNLTVGDIRTGIINVPALHRSDCAHLPFALGLAGSLILLLVSLSPTGIGIVFLHGFGENIGLFLSLRCVKAGGAQAPQKRSMSMHLNLAGCSWLILLQHEANKNIRAEVSASSQ